VAHLARSLAPEDFQTVSFRGKGRKRLRSRFSFQRVTAAHPVTLDSQTPREEWLIIEWPAGRDAPSDYWISNLPADTKPERLACLARLRWMIELDYRQLKGQLGLDHYEGRSYLGWYHHTALVTTAHAFLTLERQNPKAQRRASHSPKRFAYSSPSSTAGPGTATPATSR
jgi:SRSO17 transposase